MGVKEQAKQAAGDEIKRQAVKLAAKGAQAAIANPAVGAPIAIGSCACCLVGCGCLFLIIILGAAVIFGVNLMKNNQRRTNAPPTYSTGVISGSNTKIGGGDEKFDPEKKQVVDCAILYTKPAGSNFTYAEIFEYAGTKHGVSPAYLAAMASIESNFNPTAASAYANGLMQLTPDKINNLLPTDVGPDGQPLKRDLNDPLTSAYLSARHIAGLQAALKTTNPSIIAAGYNSGIAKDVYPSYYETPPRIPNVAESQNHARKMEAAYPRYRLCLKEIETSNTTGISNYFLQRYNQKIASRSDKKEFLKANFTQDNGACFRMTNKMMLYLVAETTAQEQEALNFGSSGCSFGGTTRLLTDWNSSYTDTPLEQFYKGKFAGHTNGQGNIPIPADQIDQTAERLSRGEYVQWHILGGTSNLQHWVTVLEVRKTTDGGARVLFYDPGHGIVNEVRFPNADSYYHWNVNGTEGVDIDKWGHGYRPK